MVFDVVVQSHFSNNAMDIHTHPKRDQKVVTMFRSLHLRSLDTKLPKLKERPPEENGTTAGSSMICVQMLEICLIVFEEVVGCKSKRSLDVTTSLTQWPALFPAIQSHHRTLLGGVAGVHIQYGPS